MKKIARHKNTISERVASCGENKNSLKEKLQNYVRMGNGVSPPQHVPLNVERDENSFWEYNSITIEMGNVDSAKGSKAKVAEIKRKFNLNKLVPIVKSMPTEPKRLEGKKAIPCLSGKMTLKSTRNVELSNYPLDVSYYADEAEEKMRSKLGLYLRARSTYRRL